MATQAPGAYYVPHYTVRFFRSLLTPASDANNKKLGPNNEPTPVSALVSEKEDSDALLSDFEDTPTTTLRGVVSSIVITGVSSTAFVATVTLMPPWDIAVRILESALIQFDSVMEIQWGYFVGGEPILSPKHLFRLSAPSAVVSANTIITIVGNDIFSASALARCERRKWPRESFKTDFDVLIGILVAIGSDMFIDDEAIPPGHALHKPGPSIGWEQNDTYWRFFRQVCETNTIGWTIIGDTITLFDKQIVARSGIRYRLLWRTEPTTDFDIPIIEFSLNPLLTLFQRLPESMGIRHSHSSLDDAETTLRNVADGKLKNRAAIGRSRLSATDPAAVLSVATKTSDKTIKASPPLTNTQTGDWRMTSTRTPNANERVDSDIANTSREANNSATVTIPGHPLIEPFMVVTLVGLPGPFITEYLIQRVTHNIGQGYTTTLELYTNASALVGVVAEGSVRPPDSAFVPGGKSKPTTDEDGNKIKPVGAP